jgi:hypothetical protein
MLLKKEGPRRPLCVRRTSINQGVQPVNLTQSTRCCVTFGQHETTFVRLAKRARPGLERISGVHDRWEPKEQPR